MAKDQMTGTIYLEDLEIGMSRELTKQISDRDITLFAEISTDHNPVHLDEDYAKATPFKGRIAHGMFCAGLISCVAGTRLPGPGCIYVDQQLRFKAPVRIGDTVTATCTIQEINAERRRVIMSTICTVADKVVVEGSAIFMVSRRTKA